MRYLIPAAALAALALAGCASTASHPPAARSPAASSPAAAGCRAALASMYRQLGGSQYGTGRFLAGVNAEHFAGTLPRACRSVPDVMALARQASSPAVKP